MCPAVRTKWITLLMLYDFLLYIPVEQYTPCLFLNKVDYLTCSLRFQLINMFKSRLIATGWQIHFYHFFSQRAF